MGSVSYASIIQVFVEYTSLYILWTKGFLALILPEANSDNYFVKYICCKISTYKEFHIFVHRFILIFRFILSYLLNLAFYENSLTKMKINNFHL